MPFRIAVDAMGGDNAPAALVRGARLALADDESLELVLVGDEPRIAKLLATPDWVKLSERVRVHHASQVVPMDAPPVEAIRQFKDASVVRMVELAAAGEIQGMISAGNTGACAAACQLLLKPLPLVARAGIAATIPGSAGPFVLCDVGANIQAKPNHLHQYARMASLYAEKVLDIASPRVSLISIGEERSKGTSLVKNAHRLLEADPTIDFVGNAEGPDLFENRCDVAICDGFVGNIVLKFAEGLAETLLATISRELEQEPSDQPNSFEKALARVKRRHDYAQYGGAPLLGLNGTCVICHGRSNDEAIRNAIKVVKRLLERELNQALTACLQN